MSDCGWSKTQSDGHLIMGSMGCHKSYDIWHMTHMYEVWNMTYDIWHITYATYIWHVTDHIISVSFNQRRQQRPENQFWFVLVCHMSQSSHVITLTCLSQYCQLSHLSNITVVRCPKCHRYSTGEMSEVSDATEMSQTFHMTHKCPNHHKVNIQSTPWEWSGYIHWLLPLCTVQTTQTFQ